MKTCPNCQHQNAESAKFCIHCGTKIATKRFRSPFVPVGNDKYVRLKWLVLFKDVFKKHTLDEAEEIFIAGTVSTTPSIEKVTSTWLHPWLYSRVFATFVISFAFLFCSSLLSPNSVSLSGLMLLGSFAIPVTAVVLFMEMNAFRDVSFYEISKFFLIGGCASILLTFLLNSFCSSVDDVFDAIITGIVEEFTKLLMIVLFVRRTPYRSILSGMLIGAAVGAGFAAFESTGYALSMLAWKGSSYMMGVIGLRAFFAPGGHVAWAAITGAALMIVAKYGDVNFKLYLKLIFCVFLLSQLFFMPFGICLGVDFMGMCVCCC